MHDEGNEFPVLSRLSFLVCQPSSPIRVPQRVQELLLLGDLQDNLQDLANRKILSAV